MNRRGWIALLGAAALSLPFAAQAQFAGPAGDGHFKDTSMLKPPTGQKVAIIVFEDMECPACAASHPIELQAAQQFHVPLVRYDFPLTMHVWSFDAAVFARYLQDKVSPALADQYRTDLFRSQISVGGKEDLQNFNRKFMQQHGQSMPFVVDPGGMLANKVRADQAVGMRLNVNRTPTIVVAAANGHYETVSGDENGSDVNRLFSAIPAAEKQVRGGAASATRTVSARRK